MMAKMLANEEIMMGDDDIYDEDMQIMKERMREEQEGVMSLSCFKASISELKMPKVLSLDVSSSVAHAVETMQGAKIGSVLITADEKLVGIFTERDILLKVVGKLIDLNKVRVDAVMTKDPLYLMKQDMIAHVMHNMHVGGFRHVPIVDNDKRPVSIVSIKDITAFIMKYIPDEVINVAPLPYRGPANRDSA